MACVGLNKDHINLIKFESKEDDDYETVSSHLSEMVEAIMTGVSLPSGGVIDDSVAHSSAYNVTNVESETSITTGSPDVEVEDYFAQLNSLQVPRGTAREGIRISL